MAVELDLLGRTSEMARTFGIDFFSVRAWSLCVRACACVSLSQFKHLCRSLSLQAPASVCLSVCPSVCLSVWLAGCPCRPFPPAPLHTHTRTQVLTRGSQYRVESMMLRLAHSQNYLAPSPSKEQVGLEFLLYIYIYSCSTELSLEGGIEGLE
jgi:hypothetical protein